MFFQRAAGKPRSRFRRPWPQLPKARADGTVRRHTASAGPRPYHWEAMASLTSSVQPQHSDPIRIVPLHLPPELEVAPLAPARLTYRCGPLLTQVNVFNLYWGLAWQT